MTLAAWLPLFTVALAAVGAVFAALRYNREDASAVVVQQSTVLADMKSLNDELGDAISRIRLERDELLVRVIECTQEVARGTEEIASLRAEVASLRADLRARRRYYDPPDFHRPPRRDGT